MARGGSRAGAGRKKNTAEEGAIGKGFATRVMSRIGELGLKFHVGELEKKKTVNIKSAEDYALNILKCEHENGGDGFFRYMVDRQFGKPVQATIQRDTRENIPDLDFGNLTVPAGGQSRKADRPN